MTIKTTLTLCKSVGCSARYISETREFRIVPPNTPEDRREAIAYYTDDRYDAVDTALSMQRFARNNPR